MCVLRFVLYFNKHIDLKYTALSRFLAPMVVIDDQYS